MPTVRIPAKLYFDLYSKAQSISLDADRLIAVYAILKSSRNGSIKYQAYTAKNNKSVSDYALLRAKTTLSLNTLKKYVPVLIQSGLCYFDKNGDFVLLGGEKTKELYNSYKLVPIRIGKNLTQTALFAMAVRVHAEHKEQSVMISKKQTRSELLLQYSNPTTRKKARKLEWLQKKYGATIEITEKTVLSNQGFAYLKDNSQDNKSKGTYWKRKLVSSSIIKSKRRFKKVQKMSYEQYKQLSKYYTISNKYTYIVGYLCIELVSSFELS